MAPAMNQTPESSKQTARNGLYRRSVELLEADVNDELVALDPFRGTCYGMNSVATDVWRKLETPRTFDELRTELLAEYDVDETQCGNDLNNLLTDLELKGLVAVDRTHVGG